MIQRIADRLRGLSRWRARAVAAGLGLLAAAALPPVYALPVLLVAVPGLIWLIDGTPTRRAAFWIGTAFGFGHFIGALHWVSTALLVDAARFGWLVPVAVVGLAALVAPFPGIAAALARTAWVPGPARIAVLAGAWGVGEWLRGWVLTGLPWTPLGMVWMPFDGILQSAALWGVYGLSLVTMLMAGAPVVLAGDAGGLAVGRRLRFGVLIAAVLAVVGLEGVGRVRLAALDYAPEPHVALRLVQPAIPQEDKWRADLMGRNLRRYVTLSRTAGWESRDLVIWGETAVPWPLNLSPEARREVAAAAPPGGLLMTGAPRRSPLDVTPPQVWNSLFVLDGGGRVRATYDKVHLVPFGEYVPLGDLLPLDKITAGSVDFSPGSDLVSMDLGGGVPPVSPLICYEVIFPGAVMPGAVGTGETGRPVWMVNLTNDGWYGRSIGPYQHFQTTRLRAIEEGVPLVRVANTGISGIIGPEGRVRDALNLQEQGILDGDLPPALAGRTLFSRFGNAVPLFLSTVFLGLGAFLHLRTRRFRRESKGKS